MQRYFSLEKVDNKFTLSKEDSYHITKVMRLTINDLVEVVNNKLLYICNIINIDNLVTVKIKEEVITKKSLLPKITLCQSLVKEAKMDLILQKNTELGVANIIPLNTERSLIKINLKEDKKIKRWETIAKEASEQSKRLDIPHILDIKNIDEVANLDFTYKILLSVNEMSNNVKRVLSNISINDTIIIVVGPEGGLTKREEKILINHGFISTTIGSLVLRTETASISIISMINYILME